MPSAITIWPWVLSAIGFAAENGRSASYAVRLLALEDEELASK
jgi:hypothetical protein